jgi:hypothetical protein
MSMQNLHKIMGSRFEHIKPNLCPTCQFYRQHQVWDGYCTAKAKLLSAPTEAKKPRCKDFQEVST